jgi:hypothetical protein
VGNRTDVRFLTDKSYMGYLSQRSGRGRRRGADDFSGERAVALLYCMAFGWLSKCMHEIRLPHANPAFVRGLKEQMDVVGGRGRIPSAGMLGIAMAVARCRTVRLFGFGNASDPNSTASCGHYWECSRAQAKYFRGKAGYHDWKAQWRLVSGWLATAAANRSHAGELTFVQPPAASSWTFNASARPRRPARNVANRSVARDRGGGARAHHKKP